MRDTARSPFFAHIVSVLVMVAMLCLLSLGGSGQAWGAVTDQTPTDITQAGVADTVSAAAVDGNTFTNTGYEFVEVINAAGAPITVTIDVYPTGGQGSPGGLTTTDPTVSVTNGTRKRIGPFRKRFFNNGAEKVLITTSSQTSITIGVYRLTPTP